ncbi:MAG: hypothetical protein ABIS18_00900 [Actinomycetota bacterium]
MRQVSAESSGATWGCSRVWQRCPSKGSVSVLKDRQPSALFARWFWLIYLPLGLFAALVGIKAIGLIGGWGNLVLVIFGAYALLAARLLMERKRLGVEVPPPAKIVAGVVVVAAVVLTGGVMFLVGWRRLGDGQGLMLLAVGGFLMITSATVSMFKLVDMAIRLLGKVGSSRRR